MTKAKKITKKGTTEAVSKSTVRHPDHQNIEVIEKHIKEVRADEPAEIEPPSTPPPPDETEILTVQNP